MPAYKFGDSENQAFELLTGDYPFEVVAVDFGIQTGTGVTKGCDYMEVKVVFFKTTEFKVKVAQWTEKLIFHKSCEWKIDTFVKASNLLIDGRKPDRDESIDFREDLVKGLRGWATCKPEQDKDNKEKKWNRVAVWITNKEKLPKYEEPSTASPEDDGYFS